MQTRGAVQSGNVSQPGGPVTTLHNNANLLQSERECATLGDMALDRAELKALHDKALAIVQAIRPLLGLEPVLTGKQVRRERYG